MEIETKPTNPTNGFDATLNAQPCEDLFAQEGPAEEIQKTITNKTFTIKDTDGSDDNSANFFTAPCDFHITNKRFMVSLKSHAQLPPQTPAQNLSLWCEYYNCLSHGTSANKMILLIGNAILNEKMENGYNPEDSECESQIETVKAHYLSLIANTLPEEDNFLELKSDYSLEVDLADSDLSEIFKLFSRCSDMNPDPEEVRGNGAGSMFAGMGLGDESYDDEDEEGSGDGDREEGFGGGAGIDMSGFYTRENVHLFEEEEE
jgi:hypothetical protein